MNLEPLEIINCEQGSPEWFEARRGCVTMSEVDSVLAKGRGKTPSKARQSYMLTLAGEILSGEIEEPATSRSLERGRIMEAEARDYYAFLKDCEPRKVGFLKRGQVGCSPDSLIGDEGLHEIKTKAPKYHLQVVLDDVLPEEHKPQCMGALWIADREWIDFQSYWPKLPPFIKRVYRDEPYIAELAAAVAQFLDELNELTEKLRRYT